LVATSITQYLAGCRASNLGLSTFLFNPSSHTMKSCQKHMVDVLLQAWSTVERNVAWLEAIYVMELRTALGVRMKGIAVSCSIILYSMLVTRVAALASQMVWSRQLSLEGSKIPSMQTPFSFPKDDMTASNAYILISQFIIIFTVLSERNMTYCRCHVFYSSLVINDNLVSAITPWNSH
jgi:hypothetical protein